MAAIDHWLLPEGIEEMLPEAAWRAEGLRRRLLDMYRSWGYELIIPPMIEYLESLLTGTGNDLDLQTFKLTDQLSGRLMGVRADMTPQAARIDAHALKREAPTRLCYLGTVLRTRPEGFAGSRSPLQVGAELFGHLGIESDLEIIGLMLETLRVTGIDGVHLDLGHVGIFRGLAREAGLADEAEADLFDVLQRKAMPEIEALVAGFDIPAEQRSRLVALAGLHGEREVLERARQVLAGSDSGVLAALDNLSQIGAEVERRWPALPVSYDLAELRGYAYQTGVVFAAFVPGCGQEVARGGRYDQIGEVFGRARPATGFSADLKTLIALGEVPGAMTAGIFAPAQGEAGLDRAVAELRAAGERVVQALPGQCGDAAAMACDRQLVYEDGAWRVLPI
ncbi:ATP phosphoribosyltransferase regulatory subunit [Thiohalobacter sp. IOR34]|uniref:ATP phosphoribosyltransferase regulatory subunit n=1 Tax=Thiohalobacter sp. IOR34 TaxID=3057176 RepID=UPI0025AF0742|nr:ATP phosphoribosyltransferase regulatory subunit [Thiohalobacter sp. IOR34]WJW74817.1 ATP phosphoribosyltransferase regulatory subunit [Thiohalobacter sp. IOR34]